MTITLVSPFDYAKPIANFKLEPEAQIFFDIPTIPPMPVVEEGEPLSRNPSLCKIGGCNRPLLCKGLCNRHYCRTRNRKNKSKSLGLFNEQFTIADGATLRKAIIIRSTADAATGCWEWNRKLSTAGYGQMWIDKKECLAHRASAVAFLGFNIDSELFVCHHCDNPCCVNPSHLFIGTPKDNTADMLRKGRNIKPWHKKAYEVIEAKPSAKEGKSQEVGASPREGHRISESGRLVPMHSLRKLLPKERNLCGSHTIKRSET